MSLLSLVDKYRVSIFTTWFTYLRNRFNHDHIKKKSLKGTFSFYLFRLFKWIHFSLYRYWKFIIWLITANYCFFYFFRIGDYVLNWSNTSFSCYINTNALGCDSRFKVHKHGKLLFNLYVYCYLHTLLFIILVSCCIYKSTIKFVIRGDLWEKDGWSFNKNNITKKVQFRWLFYDRTRNIWPLNTGDYMDRFDCIWNTANLTTSPSELPNMVFNV
jgi:hypothetical protein